MLQILVEYVVPSYWLNNLIRFCDYVCLKLSLAIWVQHEWILSRCLLAPLLKWFAMSNFRSCRYIRLSNKMWFLLWLFFFRFVLFFYLFILVWGGGFMQFCNVEGSIKAKIYKLIPFRSDLGLFMRQFNPMSWD